MRGVRRRTVRGLAVVGVAVSAAVPATVSLAQAGYGTDSADYRGTIVGDPTATVALTRTGTQKKPGIRAEFTNLLLRCEDGSTRRISASTGARIKRRGRFHAEYEDPGFDETVEYYEELGGRLVSDRRAKGYFVWVVDILNPTASGRPDCSTEGRVRWEAEGTG